MRYKVESVAVALLMAIAAAVVLAGCSPATRESQLIQVEVLKQVRSEWQNHHKALTDQIRADKAQALDLAFRVDLAADAEDGKVPVERVYEHIAKRREKVAEVDANLDALDAQFQQRIDLVNRAIELGAVTAETLDAWAQVQLLLHNEATNPTLIPLLREEWK